MLPTRYRSAWPSPAATTRSATASSRRAATSSRTTWPPPASAPATTSASTDGTRSSSSAAFLACYKLRAIPVNVNYRYVEAELRYLFAEAELVGLVHDRQFSEQGRRAAARLSRHPGCAGDRRRQRRAPLAGQRADFAAALAGQPAERDFGERSADDIYMLYTGGTTGYPKGVLWRHEDVWRTLGGGIDFATGERPARRVGADPAGRRSARRAGPAERPRRSFTAARSGARWPALFCGDTVVFVPQFDPHDVWRAVQRHRVNVLMIIGDAMARPLIEAYQEEEYDLSSVLAISSNAALFSPVVKDAVPHAAAERRHHRRDRRLRDRLHRARLRVGGQQEGRGPDGHARARRRS